jgi:hypothetical protein
MPLGVGDGLSSIGPQNVRVPRICAGDCPRPWVLLSSHDLTLVDVGRNCRISSGVHADSSPVFLGTSSGLRSVEDDLVKLKLDLHEIYNRGADIDRALRAIIDEAVAKKAPVVEIIPGKGSGQLKKRVLRFLDRKDIKALYHRVEKDSDNFGRVFVHFRWK